MDGTPELFNHIAEGYDRWSLILSAAGIHFWHHSAMDALAIQSGQTILDVGCGTGTETRALASRVGKQGRVVGLDPAREMLDVARSLAHLKDDSAPIDWTLGDAEHMPFSDQSFDGVTAQFSLRNMENWRQGLRHMIRVLKPNGRLVILEMVQPVTTEGSLAWRSLSKVTQALPSSSLTPYQWLGESLWHAPTAHELTVAAKEYGLVLQVTQSWLGGLVVVLSGTPSLEKKIPKSNNPIAVWAVDGSLTAQQGGRWMSQLLPHQFTIHLVTVIASKSAGSAMRDANIEAWHRAQRHALADWPSDSQKLVPIVLDGEPAKQIVDYAQKVGADLIVIGHKRREPYAERMAGGLTQYVLDHAPCPVLTVGLPDVR